MRYLIPVDDTGAALRAAEHVAGLADPQREAVLLAVLPEMPRHLSRLLPAHARDDWRREQAERRFARPLAFLRQAGVPVRTRIARGSLGETIARVARDEEVREVVWATRREPAWLALVGASRTEAVIDRSPVPVAVIADGRPSTLERFGVPAGLGLGLTALVLAAD